MTGFFDAPADTRRSHVYVMALGDGKSAKIGMTSNPKARRSAVQNGSRLPVFYAYISPSLPWQFAKWIEEDAHAHLADHREMGEWFSVPPSEAVAAVLSRVGGK